jgi:DNA-binding transcriptional ArsR family regulator
MPMILPNADMMAVARAAALFRGLADRTRLAILLQLRGGERRVVDLVEATMRRVVDKLLRSHLLVTAAIRSC